MTKRSCFYVLQCNDGTLYAGYTVDMLRRLKEHNSGQGAKYTRITQRRPMILLYCEYFDTKSEAMKQEYAFKQLTRSQKEAYLAQAIQRN